MRKLLSQMSGIELLGSAIAESFFNLSDDGLQFG